MLKLPKILSLGVHLGPGRKQALTQTPSGHTKEGALGGML